MAEFLPIVGLIWIVSIIAFLLGMINPQIVIFWREKPTRVDALLCYLFIPTVLAIVIGSINYIVEGPENTHDRLIIAASLIIFLFASLTVIGLIRPNYVIRWGNFRDRTRVLLCYGIPTSLIVGIVILLQLTLTAIDKREIQEQWTAFPSVFATQVSLEMENNSVVGIKGIIVDGITLNKAIKDLDKNPHTVRNFRFIRREHGFKYYVSLQQMDKISIRTIIAVKNDIVEEVMVITVIGNENVLREVYNEICLQRRARLGYPSTESAGMLEWNYPNSTYTLLLSRTDKGTLQIRDFVNSTATQ